MFGFNYLLWFFIILRTNEIQSHGINETDVGPHPYGNTICRYGLPGGKIHISREGHRRLEFREPVLARYKNESSRSLALCILNQRTGIIIFYKEFPLFKLWAVWMDLERHLKNIAPERIVVLQTEGKSVMGIRNATHFMSSLGSVLVEHLEATSIWTWAFVHGGKTIFETFVSSEYVKTYQLTSSHSWISLSNVSEKFSKFSEERELFCSKYGVMGNLCDEGVPFSSLYHQSARTNDDSLLRTIPVIVTAGERVSYLYQSLLSYLNAKDVIKLNFHVLLGTNSTQTIELLNILGLNYTYIPPSRYNDNEFFPFLYYKEVYQFVSDNFGNSKYIIFLEEDVEVAPDFFSYIKETIHLLDKDPTLYCIAGFSATGLKYLAHEESILLRASVQVGWGYAVTSNFVREALKLWPTERMSRLSVYDGYLYDKVRGNRECVLPEVSRTKHFGTGMNSVYLSMEKVFLTMPIAKSVDVIYKNVDILELSKWNKNLRKEIASAIPVSENVCRKHFLTSISPGSYVMYYNLTKENENSTYINFFTLGNCFKTWVYSEQGQHDYVNILKISPNTTFYLVAHPQSAFSDLKPRNYDTFDIRSLSKEDYRIYVMENIEVQKLSYMEYKNPSSAGLIENLFL